MIYIGTPITFDPFVIELFLALTTGACLLIVPPRIKNDKTLLLETLFPKNGIHTGVTFLQMPPSVFLTFPEDKIKDLLMENSSLRILALGGENFPEQILKYVNKENNLRIFNLYGITEMSSWAAVQEINCKADIILGEALDGTILEVKGDEGTVVPGDSSWASVQKIYCRENNSLGDSLDDTIEQSDEEMTVVTQGDSSVNFKPDTGSEEVPDDTTLEVSDEDGIDVAHEDSSTTSLEKIYYKPDVGVEKGIKNTILEVNNEDGAVVAQSDSSITPDQEIQCTADASLEEVLNNVIFEEGNENVPAVIQENSPKTSVKKFLHKPDVSLGEPLNDTILEVRDEEGNIITQGIGEMFVGK